MLIKDLLLRQKENDSIAIKHGTSYISFRDWNNVAALISNNIINLLSKTSTNVATLLPNSINYAIAYFAVQYANKVLIPISIQSKDPELLATLEYCETDLIITDSKHFSMVRNVIGRYNYRMFVYNIETSEIIEINSNKQFVPKTECLLCNGFEDDVAIMLHTSGTTSNPKRVMLTHRNIISNIESNIASLGLTQQDKVLIAMPMIFGYCHTAQFLTHLYLGASMVIMDTVFLPKQFFKIVESECITNFTGVPTMLQMILNYRYADEYDYSSLRYICFGGGKMPLDKLKQLIERFLTVGFVQTYGQTECSPRVTALLPEFSVSKLGSVGKPIPGVKINVVDENGADCRSNEKGEILVYGENTMKGYYKQDTITSQTIQDGWIHTGDIGYRDSDGFLYLTGRIKNMIISGGINIYPEEIEEVILQNDYVEDVCVLGAYDELLGEIPIAKVVINGSIDLNELRSYCMKNLASYKVPARFEIISNLTKTYNGKNIRY